MTEPCRVREALERALLAFDNVLGELEAHQENTGEALEEEDQAVVHGAKADAEFARAALSASPAEEQKK